jgi:hypothetical protein
MSAAEPSAATIAPPLAWRPPPDALSVLLAADIASPEAIAAARMCDVSRSHSVTRVELPNGTAFVVKSLSQEALAAGRSLAAELYAYRLSTWQPGLAAAIPSPIHLDERREVLVLAAAPADHLYAAQSLGADFPSPDVAAALGLALANIHGATSDAPLPTFAACGILDLPDTPEDQRRIGTGTASGTAVARTVTNDTCLGASLRRTAALRRPSCLVHGDLKWDNVALDPGPPAQVRLFDWELSGFGDPAWDVGSALADTVSLKVRWCGRGAIPLHPGGWMDAASRALIVAYATPALPSDFAARVVGSWTARLAHLALECAVALDDPRHTTVGDLLATARALAGAHDEVVCEVDRAIAGKG